jgi:hypothetical protein
MAAPVLPRYRIGIGETARDRGEQCQRGARVELAVTVGVSECRVIF